MPDTELELVTPIEINPPKPGCPFMATALSSTWVGNHNRSPIP